MLDFAKQWVINIVALVLFIVMFEILLPTGKMKKYVNLVTGTILIIAIISPLTGLLGRNFDVTAFQTANSNYLDRLQVEKDSKLLQKEQTKQIIEVYRNKIIEQLEQSSMEVKGVKSVKADVIINEDTESKTFGEIKRAYIEIETQTPAVSGSDKSKGGSAGEGDSSVGSGNAVNSSTSTGIESTVKARDGVAPVEAVRQVQKVIIGSGTSELQGSVKNCDPAVKKALEEKISGIYGISKENIIISQSKR